MSSEYAYKPFTSVAHRYFRCVRCLNSGSLPLDSNTMKDNQNTGMNKTLIQLSAKGLRTLLIASTNFLFLISRPKCIYILSLKLHRHSVKLTIVINQALDCFCLIL